MQADNTRYRLFRIRSNRLKYVAGRRCVGTAPGAPLKRRTHVETEIGGQRAVVDVKVIAINGPLPEGVFDLPAEVWALKEKKLKDAERDSLDRPTLKRDK